jgi:hypothetical protein
VFGDGDGDKGEEGEDRHIKIKFCNLYCSLKIMTVIKSGAMRWAEHVARVGAD